MKMRPTMSWFWCLWISASAVLLCQASLYDTIQQHHLASPGRSSIQILDQHCGFRSLNGAEVDFEKRGYRFNMLIDESSRTALCLNVLISTDRDLYCQTPDV
ncbi:hypothetical protein Z043_121345 [Scleropages formosus]|uniref:Uncharacterized protein n=1 Tax=Scleropages formosus TaxID=113540 RepID=A0A0P7WC51_SCLFO|nr:hypothetical protein Z043_121345 [Scleropages formosus]